MVKKVFLMAALAVCTVIHVSCLTDAHSTDYDSLTAEVDAYLEDFEIIKDQCQITEINYDQVSSEGGYVIGYCMGDTLKYMEAGIFGKMGRVFYDIYYTGDSTLYLVNTRYDYDKPMYEEGFTEKETISRYIMMNNKMYEYTDELNAADTETKDHYTAMIEDFERSLKEYVSRDEIIRIFHDNYDVFESIADYAIKADGNFHVYRDESTGEIVIDTDKPAGEVDKNVRGNIDMLMNDLHFRSIVKMGSSMYFYGDSGSGNEICYTSEPFNSNNYREVEEIKENWYYLRISDNPTDSPAYRRRHSE